MLYSHKFVSNPAVEEENSKPQTVSASTLSGPLTVRLKWKQNTIQIPSCLILNSLYVYMKITVLKPVDIHTYINPSVCNSWPKSFSCYAQIRYLFFSVMDLRLVFATLNILVVLPYAVCALALQYCHKFGISIAISYPSSIPPFKQNPTSDLVFGDPFYLNLWCPILLVNLFQYEVSNVPSFLYHRLARESLYPKVKHDSLFGFSGH